MKRLSEYTDEELVALDTEEIANLTNIECAHEGAPLLSMEAPAPISRPDVVPDVQCFMVENSQLLYSTADEATRVAEFLSKTARLAVEPLGKSYWGPPYQVGPLDVASTIKSERHWTGSFYKDHQKELEQYETDKAKFDAATKEFRNLREARDVICLAVTGRLNDAREAIYLCESLKAQFKDYCELANGDKELALAFLLKVTSHNESFMRTTLNMEGSTNGEETNSFEED